MAKHRNKIILTILILLVLAAAGIVYENCHVFKGSPMTEKVVFSDAIPWNSILSDYYYKDYYYTTTKNVIPSWLVGKKLERAVWNGSSGASYDVFEIKTEWTHMQVVFKTQNGYLLLNKTKKRFRIL